MSTKVDADMSALEMLGIVITGGNGAEYVDVYGLLKAAQAEDSQLRAVNAELLEALRDLCICVAAMSGGIAQMDKLIPAYTKACKAIWKAESRS